MSLQKYFFFFFLYLSFSSFSFSQSLTGKANTYATDSVNFKNFYPGQVSLTDSIVNYGKIFLNSPYRSGGKGSAGSFDCSGFTSFVYSNFGYKLGASSSDQAEQFDAVDRLSLKKGDLVFFSGRRAGKRVGHVGIVVNTNPDGNFNFIHASTQHGVIISSSDEPYYLRRYIKAGRVVFNNQHIAIAPTVSHVKKIFSQTLTGNSVSPIVGSTVQTEKIIPAQYHRVKKGENLADIAIEYGLTLFELKQKNKIKGNKITPNQRLKVKDAETVLVIQSIEPQSESKVQLSDNLTKPDSLKVESKVVSSRMVSSLTKIAHTVKKGETLFSISNLYNISVDQLKQINNMFNGIVHIGQKLKIYPVEKATPSAEVIKTDLPEKPEQTTKPDAQTKAENPTPQIPKTHKVEAGETLFGIAKMYNIPVDELRKLNNFAENKIKAGQVIKLTQTASESVSNKATSLQPENKKLKPLQKLTHKVKSGETFYSIARLYGCKVDELKEWNKKSANKIKSGEKLLIYQKAN